MRLTNETGYDANELRRLLRGVVKACYWGPKITQVSVRYNERNTAALSIAYNRAGKMWVKMPAGKVDVLVLLGRFYANVYYCAGYDSRGAPDTVKMCILPRDVALALAPLPVQLEEIPDPVLSPEEQAKLDEEQAAKTAAERRDVREKKLKHFQDREKALTTRIKRLTTMLKKVKRRLSFYKSDARVAAVRKAGKRSMLKRKEIKALTKERAASSRWGF